MISVNQLSVIYGQRALFNEISFFIGPEEKIGLVGKNGAGKSTLLKALYGLQPATKGNVTRPKDVTLGYLPQEMEHAEDTTIMEEASKAFEEIQQLENRMSAISKELEVREDYESDAYLSLITELNEVSDRLNILGSSQTNEQIERILLGLGFLPTDFDRKMSEFSGGWKMRVELSKLLLVSPSLLLLDEPTNHLDIESIEWLEQFLKTYQGAILLISHDRTFLDEVTGRTIEISNGKVYDYKFSYSKYQVQRAEEVERQFTEYKAQQKYIEETEQLINKFRAKKNKASFAQSLIKKLDKLERIDVDGIDDSGISFSFPPAPRSGKMSLHLSDIDKSYGDKHIFDGIEMKIGRQEKVALVGKNGAGKTTLTRIILKEEKANGSVEIGHNVDIGYYAQNQTDHLDGDKTVFETIDDVAVGDIRTKIRGLLGSFLFQGEDIDKKVKVLSGGEKARLALCKLLLHPYNFLILDEPTNHLDLKSKEVLKSALLRFDGTLLVVSHDRDFLHGLTDYIFEVGKERLRQYNGDILDFLKEKRANSIAQFEAAVQKQKVEKEKAVTQDSGLSYKEKKQLEKDRRKLANLISRTEKEIEELEAETARLTDELNLADYADKQKTEPLLQAFNAAKTKLDKSMSIWEDAERDLTALDKQHPELRN